MVCCQLLEGCVDWFCIFNQLWRAQESPHYSHMYSKAAFALSLLYFHFKIKNCGMEYPPPRHTIRQILFQGSSCDINLLWVGRDLEKNYRYKDWKMIFNTRSVWKSSYWYHLRVCHKWIILLTQNWILESHILLCQEHNADLPEIRSESVSLGYI